MHRVLQRNFWTLPGQRVPRGYDVATERVEPQPINVRLSATAFFKRSSWLGRGQ